MLDTLDLGSEPTGRRGLQGQLADGKPIVESLEPRLLLSGLLGITPVEPLIQYDNVGTLAYETASQALNVVAAPLSFQQVGGLQTFIYSTIGDFAINIEVDNAGNLVGGVAGDDLVISGDADLDGDYIPDVSGVLLTGEILEVGSLDTGTAVDSFDFRFALTGGLLAGYYSGNDLGVTLTSENSSFTDDFSVDFGGGAKGHLGAIDPLPVGGSLGDTVWHDLYHGPGHLVDGIQDEGEPGIAGVVVNLLDSGGAPLASATTNAAGFYEFTGVAEGSYYVEVDASNFAAGGVLEGSWYATLQNAGTDDALDSDGDPATHRSGLIALEAGENDLATDFGYFLTAVDLEKTGPECVIVGDTIAYHFRVENTGDVVLHSGAVVYDEMINPCGNHQIWQGVLQPGEVAEFDRTYSTSCSDLGELVNTATGVGHPIHPDGYSLADVTDVSSWTVTVGCSCPGPTVGDLVWEDLNANGIQDAGEPGIPGVTVNLLQAACGNFVAGTITDADGQYLFEDLEVGDYKIEVIALAGYGFTAQDQGSDDAVDSDADSAGMTGVIALVEGESNLTVDAGLYLLVPPEPAILSGLVYLDANNNGVADPGEEGLSEVTITLTGTDDLGDDVVVTALTDTNGEYIFDSLRPGTYTITETQDEDLLDGDESAGNLGGTVTDDVIGEIVVASDDVGTGYNFGELEPASLSGAVYVDFNDDAELDFNENIIVGVDITLTGTNDRGEAVNLTIQTDEDGEYAFSHLRPGTYTVTEAQPAGFLDGQDAVGTEGGTLGNDEVSNIALGVAADGMGYDFGERPEAGGEVACGQTASIGFWRSRKGKRLILSLNGGATDTQLGYWLAATYPSIYGAEAGENSLAGMTNRQVWRHYRRTFRAKKCGRWWRRRFRGPRKLDAQVMALAFATYVTNESLAGQVGTNYGFTVTEYGVGIATFNVGDAGQAFGVEDDTEMTVMDILQATNDQAVDGELYDGNVVLRSMANAVFTAINEAGSCGYTGCNLVNWFLNRLQQLLANCLN